MAEFVQVMKEWSRMCLSFKSCSDCPMMNEDGRAHILCSEGGIRSTVPEVQEDVIIKWAAKHPVVYPTWCEWLVSIGAMTRRVRSNIASELIETGLFNPIPPDVARKLGIEPKEAK